MQAPAVEVEVAYRNLAAGVSVFATRKEGEFLCEGPSERLDLTADALLDEDTESVIRLFTDIEDAERYAAIWRELLDLSPRNQAVAMMRVSLRDVWKHLGAAVANSYGDYQVPPRIELCRLSNDGEVVVIDTLFTERESAH